MLTLVERAPVTRVKPDQVVTRMASRMPWAWDGLIWLTAMDEARPYVYEMVSGQRGTLNGSARWSDTELGLVLDGGANTAGSTAVQSWATFGSTSPMGGQTKLSGFVVAKIDGLPTISNTVARVVSKWETVGCQVLSGGTFSWTVFGDPPGGPSQVLGRSATANHSYSPGSWGIFGMTWNGSTIDVFEGGRFGASSTASDLTAGLASTSYQLMMMGGHTNDPDSSATSPIDAFQGEVALAAFWNRPLSRTEHAALAADPFGMISPRRETLVIASPFPLVGFSPHHIGSPTGMEVNAPVDAQGRITELSLTTLDDQGARLSWIINGVAGSQYVAPASSYTKPVNEATETVTRFGVEADPEPGG